MKNITMKVIPAVAVVATMVLANIPALADSVSVSSTTSTTCPVQSIGTAPFMVVNDCYGTPSFVESRNTLQVVPVITTGATITGVSFYVPRDDLFGRRDDLLARILTEQNRGKLTASEALDLTGRVMAIDGMRAQLPLRTETTAFYKQVHHIYFAYNSLANDIANISRQEDKQLAGTYNYMVF